MKAFNKDKELRKLKFRQNRGKYIKYGSIVLSCLILVIGIIMFTFAKFESTSEWTLIEGTVTESSKDANIIAIYQGDTKVDTVPARNSNYVFDRAECTNGATAKWDYEEWSLITHFETKTKCSIYFRESLVCNLLNNNCDLNTIGAEVRIGGEEFYVIGQEGLTYVKLLSKWNLNVGSNPKGIATGLQDSDVRGIKSGMTVYGNVAFSSTNYWHDSTNNKTKNEYSGYTYNTSTHTYINALGKVVNPYVYDGNSDIKTYVDTYVTYLRNQGVYVIGRLINYGELVSLGCDASATFCSSSIGGTAPSWVYQTSYWSGSADNEYGVWSVNSNGRFVDYESEIDDYFGVRPVIILEI